MSDHPKYLFHYTSVENLCLILKNRSIKFNRLDKVNDPDEGLTKFFPDSKSFTYVSCWTSEERESLPLWNMYSADMKGVRIRLLINMFKGRRNPEYETTGFPIIFVDQSIRVKRKSFGYSSLLIGPSKVEYLKNPLNTNDCFVENEDHTVDTELLHLGLTKHDYWKFEKEWRYKIIGMPFEGKWMKDDYSKFFEVPISEHLDLYLDETVFSEMIVQLGPKATISESTIVNLLIKEHAYPFDTG